MTDQAPEPDQEVSIEVDWTGADLTLNERVAVEDACGGRAFEVLRSEGRSSFFRAVAWVMLRRSDPRITIDEAGDLKVRFDG